MKRLKNFSNENFGVLRPRRSFGKSSRSLATCFSYKVRLICGAFLILPLKFESGVVDAALQIEKAISPVREMGD